MLSRFSFLVLVLGLGGCQSKTYESSETTTFQVSIPMRDGIKLSATVIEPEAKIIKRPVVLIRSPYGRGGGRLDLTELGYVVVCQDVRGRGSSGGRWEPFLNERQDGYDTIEWIAKQPWCDGNVGMIGESYMGFVQWAAAAERPPSLKCIVPIVSPPDPFLNLPYENGCFLEAVNLWYCTIIGQAIAPDRSMGKPKTGFATWPVLNADLAVNGSANDIYRRWVRMDRPEDWTRGETLKDLKDSKLPSLSISGWFDGDLMGTQMHWETRSTSCKDQWVVLGPWGHDQSIHSPTGGIAIAPGNVPDLSDIEHRFFARWLRGETSALDNTPHVQAFVLGANKWVHDDQWPLKQSVPQKYYLTAAGLSETMEDGTTSRSYDYDPLHVRIPSPLKAAPLDDTLPFRLTSEELPYGRLIYQGKPMASATTITGPAHINLAFSSSAKDTDFFAQLYDESPDGSLIPIGQAAKFRVKAFVTTGKDMEPGQHYSATVPFWESLYEISKGHRLSLMISSDKLPVYALNPNTGDPLATATRTVVAHQTVWAGGPSGSQIEVGVLRGDR